MAKKRKSDATRLDEVDRTMYTSFCGAANSLSQLYTQAMNHQRLSFQAGERHAQNELDCGAEETPVSPRLPFQHQHFPTAAHLTNSSMPVSSNSFGPSTLGQGTRAGHSDQQSKNSVFSNALSSPVRRSLQHYHLGQGSYYPNNVMSSGNGLRNNETNYNQQQNRDLNSLSSNDSSMDMHADSPGHESPY
ncbi:uncharacterized protein LOC131160503 isoform X2 [Malania oleifera]|uniref:uncharacterized protein LOC131160503 isoform X2 n=1 Tax=Malania oleifera TaxID=397392 RepID=UPI0025ADD4BC|nr:uncharacterized protein LOC131160503 isoform X2 [Malania oleifera]